MQERARLAARAVAVTTAVILLAVGLLGARHEAEAAHVRDHQGTLHHAQELAEHHHEGAVAHLHGREVHDHEGPCTLLAITHQTIVAAPRFVTSTALVIERAVAIPPVHTTRGSIAPYRLAPKTSPPARA